MSLADKLQDSLDKWDIVSLNSELRNKDNHEWIANNAWDIVPILVEPATQENLEKCPQVVSACSKLLADTIAELGQPKEIIIALLEHCEHSGTTVRLRHCLPALQVSLLKLEVKAAAVTWDWALHSVIDHFVTLELPDLQELEGDERLLLEHDKEYIECLSGVDQVADVLTSLTMRVQEYDCNEVSHKTRGHIIWACMQLLGRPLAFCNVSSTIKDQPTFAKAICCKLKSNLIQLCNSHLALADLRYFSALFGNPKVLSSDSPQEAEKQIKIWSYGFANLMFCHSEDEFINLPLCYNPLHLFNTCLRPTLKMLIFVPGVPSHYMRQEKALTLCSRLMKRIAKNQVPNDALEMPCYTDFVAQLHSIIVYHGLESLRKMAFSVYDFFFGLFGQQKPKSVSMLVNHVLMTANHSGLIGHAIGKLKNAILEDLKQEELSADFSRQQIRQLVKKFCKLSNGAETDLLEVSDEVMSSLNFLVCCLLRDKSNKLGIWDLVAELETEYLKPLAAGLNMSRAHYNLKLKNSSEGTASDSPDDVTLMVGGQTLPEMSPEQMRQVLQSALNTFDVMECVLCQLNEVIASNKMN